MFTQIKKKALKGVKQGEPLSPVLLSSFINDMCNGIDNDRFIDTAA